MKCSEDLRQQLWELVYGLLPPEEAEPLCEKITTDPLVARAYSETKLRAELVTAAAKCEEARLSLNKPSEEGSLSLDEPSTVSAVLTAPVSDFGWSRLVNYLVSLAALALVMFAGYGYLAYGSRFATSAISRERDEAANVVMRTFVAGPSVIASARTSSFAIRNSAYDDTPKPAEVTCRLEAPNGDVVLEQELQTDDNGVGTWTFQVPSTFKEDYGRVWFRAEGGPAVETEVAVDDASDFSPDDTATYLHLGIKLADRRKLPLAAPSTSETLVVVTDHNGRQISQQLNVPLADGTVRDLEPKLIESVNGSASVTVYDVSGSPPVPLTYRYFFVPSEKRLGIKLLSADLTFEADEEVRLEVQTSQEGQPAKAALRGAVVDQLALGESLREASDAEKLYFEAGGVRTVNGGKPADEVVLWSESSALATPPVRVDNFVQAEQVLRQSLSDIGRRHESRLKFVGGAILAASGLLLAILAALAMFKLVRDVRVLVPVGSAAALCLLVGCLWATAQVDQGGQIALLPRAKPRATDDTSEPAIAQNDLTPLGFSTSSGQIGGQSPATDGVASTPLEEFSTTDAPSDPRSQKSKDLTKSPRYQQRRLPGKGGGESFAYSKEGGRGSSLGGLGGMGGGTTGAFTPAPITTDPASRSGSDTVAFDFYKARFDPDGMGLVPAVRSEPQIETGEDGKYTFAFKPLPPGRYHVFLEGRAGESVGLNHFEFVVRETQRQEAAMPLEENKPAKETKPPNEDKPPEEE